MDWIPAAIALAGVLVGVGIQELRLWRERKDKYKDMVFEKRLDAHQGAYYWCMRLFGNMRPDKLMRDGGVETAMAENQEAMEWFNKNALYLDENSRSKLTSFMLFVRNTSIKYKDEEWKKRVNVEEEMMKILENMSKVASSIKKGVGAKYLPEQEVIIDSTEIAGALNDIAKGIKRFREEQEK